MFEHRSRQPLSKAKFAGRMLRWFLATLCLLMVSLLAGVLGYHVFEAMPWIDALENASMILGGMGPVDTLHTPEGKLFASFYAIYCGIFLVVCGGVLLVPIFHRVLHHFHADQDSD